MNLSETIIKECRTRLLQMKQDIINRIRDNRHEFTMNDKAAGDEADQTMALLNEHSILVNQNRYRVQLFEIESALARMENGSFGLCEETQEPIEISRLLALPHTRYCIEGAEMREAMNKKFIGL